MRYLVLIAAFLTNSVFAGTSLFSMNVHCALGDWKARTNVIIAEIIKRDPDIIGLQEVCYNSEVNMTKYIVDELKRLRYPVKFYKTADTHRSFVKYQEQLLIISKKDVLHSEESWLPSMKFFENKYLAIETEDFWAVTTHFHFALPQIRERQYKFVSQKFSDKKVIIFGDMNSNPDDNETKVMHELNWTPHYGGPTYPASKPNKTFDGFWASPSFSEMFKHSKFEVLLQGSEPEPSDHLGVWLELK